MGLEELFTSISKWNNYQKRCISVKFNTFLLSFANQTQEVYEKFNCVQSV